MARATHVQHNFERDKQMTVNTYRLIFSGINILIGLLYINQASAISAPVTIDFSGLVQEAYYGKANISPTATQGCETLTTPCYFEKGFSIGTVIDPIQEFAHLHRLNDASVNALNYHSDSGGIYIRSTDMSAFSLDSFLSDTGYLKENPLAGQPGSSWEILGFGEALNPDVAAWDWKKDPTYGGKRIAYQVMPNSGKKETIILNDQFKNVKAVWIHYIDQPRAPTDNKTRFGIEIYNIQLSPPKLTNCN